MKWKIQANKVELQFEGLSQWALRWYCLPQWAISFMRFASLSDSFVRFASLGDSFVQFTSMGNSLVKFSSMGNTLVKFAWSGISLVVLEAPFVITKISFHPKKNSPSCKYSILGRFPTLKLGASGIHLFKITYTKAEVFGRLILHCWR